eukprot:superscaffoldBa00004575_g19109
MSLSASCESVSQKRTVSSLLAGRVVKRPKQGDGQRLQEAAIQLLEQQQNLCSLLREVGNPNPSNIFCTETGGQKPAGSKGILPTIAGSLLVCELRRQAAQLGVPLAALSVKMVLERLTEITGTEEEEEEEDKRRELLTSSQRVQLCVLLESSRELLSQGALCPKLLWQEYRRGQGWSAAVELVLSIQGLISCSWDGAENDEGVRLWLVSQLKALCGWTPPPGEKEAQQVQLKVLSTVLGVLVGTGFQLSHDPAAADRRISLLCCSVLDDMLFWLLDTVDKSLMLQSAGAGAELWCQLFDASLCGASVSPEALQRFFTHSLTQTLTYKPRLTVSDAITLQNEWTFAKACRLLTFLFRKLAVIFSVEQLLRHLQQVLETHEVNWKHILCFLSTLLIYNPCAEPSLKELLSRLLSSAFEGYDLENMITAFLLARQGALEGPGIFPSYSDWFKMSFGGGSSCHATSKKSLVFLLKFLSDLVPFEPAQYLKIHILHPPYVPVKHRSLLMEYVSLAKTRLADLKGSSLSAAHLLGLAAFVVHLNASMTHSPLVQLVPPILPKPVPIVEALSSALVCSTHNNMLFCVRLCVAAVCYGICRGDSLPQQQQDYISSSLYKKLLYLIPRLLPEARRTPADGPLCEYKEESSLGLWSSATHSNSTWRKTAWCLWRHPAFCQLQYTLEYQLSFTEWLSHELKVQRSEDALSDPERQEYQQWACLELYLSCPEEEGGCGGDMKSLCSHLLSAIMDQQLSEQSSEKLHHTVSETGSCLPDILSRLQELVYEMEVSTPDMCDFLFELVSQSMLLQQSAELLHRAVRCPGFLHTAVLCYINLLQLFLEGNTPPPITEPPDNQVETSQILNHAKQFLLKAISQASPTTLSSSQLRQVTYTHP